jgi:hypothetical protein
MLCKDEEDKTMARFVAGQPILIPCNVESGAFASEFLVTFEALEGPVSGFVRENNLQRTGAEGGEAYLFATVKDVSEDTLTVVVRGSFFTTTGVAHLKADWANSHVRAAHV